jgi:hypothetical protein
VLLCTYSRQPSAISYEYFPEHPGQMPLGLNKATEVAKWLGGFLFTLMAFFGGNDLADGHVRHISRSASWHFLRSAQVAAGSYRLRPVWDL